MIQHMYKVLEVSLIAKCLLGISTAPGINSYGRVHYHLQVGYHNTYLFFTQFGQNWNNLKGTIKSAEHLHNNIYCHLLIVMVPTLWTIMNSSYYYEYRENIHLGVKLTPA